MARTRKWQKSVVAAMVAGGVGLLAPATAGAAVVCGQTITQSTTLTQDLNCSGTALFISTAGVILNLAGHTITGPAPVGGNSFIRGISISGANVSVLYGTIRGFDRGVHVGTGANGALLSRLTLDGNGLGIGSDRPTSGARIAGNTIQNTVFFSAIQLGGTGHRVEGNTISNTAATGVLFSGDENVFFGNRISDVGGSAFATSSFGGANPGPYLRNQIVKNVIAGSARVFTSSSVSVVNGSGTMIDGNIITGRNTTPGVFVDSSANTTISNNAASVNSTGILLRGPSTTTLIADNKVYDSHFTGILVESVPTGTVVSGNLAFRNGLNGIDVASPATTISNNTAYANGGLGIRAVAGVTDGGGNHATGNGNAAQCSPTIAC